LPSGAVPPSAENATLAAAIHNPRADASPLHPAEVIAMVWTSLDGFWVKMPARFNYKNAEIAKKSDRRP
jgi:hypothetical protein